MKIAIFTDTYFPFISGVVTHIETLKNGLEAQGHEVLIVTVSPKHIKHTIKNGVLYCPAIALKKIYGYGVTNSINLKRLSIIKKFNPDIIHLHTEFSMGLFALYAARKLKKPVIYTLHTMYDDYLFYVAKTKHLEKAVKPAAHLFFKKIANRSTEIIGPSLKVVEFLRRCGVQKHVNIIYNTVDLSNFLPQNQDEAKVQAVRDRLGIKPDDTALCFVGRLGKEKSIDVMIDFLAENFKGNTKVKLFVIGDGPEKDSLNAQIERLGMKGQIKLLGRIDHEEIPPYYQACNLFGTASLSEMNSISMLEAMASGLYVVQRLDIYNKNQISEGENGSLFTKSSDFATIIKDYMKLNPDERKQKRQTVTATTQRYGEAEFTSAVYNVYQRAIDKYKN